MRQILMSLAILLLPHSVSAQEEVNNDTFCRHEIAIGTGGGSLAPMFFSIAFFGATVEGLEARHPITIPVSIHYFYRLSEKWAVGATAHYEQADKMDFFYGVMPHAKWTWLNRKHICLYSRFGVGLMYVYKINEDNFFFPDFQLSPIGIEVGWKHLWVYADAGAGLQDFAQIGFKYRF